MNNANGKEFRGLSSKFREDLRENGFLSSLLDLIKKDSSLSLEVRNDYVNVYYRGGNLLKLSEVKQHVYSTFFNKNYCNGKAGFLEKLPQKIHSACDIERWLEKFPTLKSEMDRRFSNNPETEREFQQIVVWANNNSPIANDTDYFIIDIEYNNKRGGQFDMVAIQWDSESGARKLLGGYCPKLCFVEMKYGDCALDRESGMLVHANQWSEYLTLEENRKDIKKEMLNVFEQKRELCLIGGLEGNRNTVKNFVDDIDCIFLLANHAPGKSNLQKIIKEIEQIEIPGVRMKFCISNFMGYGLYKQNIYGLKDFMDRFKEQI